MCKYCEYQTELEIGTVASVYIKGRNLVIDTINSIPREEIRINYCPMCGKLLFQASNDSLYNELQEAMKQPVIISSKKISETSGSVNGIEPQSNLEPKQIGYTERDLRLKFLLFSFKIRKEIGNKLIPNSFDSIWISEMQRSINFLNDMKQLDRYNDLWKPMKYIKEEQ